MKRLPIGIQDFRKLREGGFLYVDKTASIHQLTESGGYYFLSRPRRFGKSLTLSTLKELYSGSRELFKGLWIEPNWNWERINPVIHVGFSSIGYQQLGLEKAIDQWLRLEAEHRQITLYSEGIGPRFAELIRNTARQEKVVLLIDEYDKPLIDYINEIDKAKEHQQILKNFYSVVKDSDPFLELVLITGVSKFSKVSIFSDLNNLNDITHHPAYSQLVGYTQAELENYFAEGLQSISKSMELSREELLEKIRDWYNGYSWDARHFLYNPFSILSFFDSRQFQNFWFATGTPSFLVNYLREREVYNLENIEIGSVAFESYTLDDLDPIQMLFQTGYLTIKSVNEFQIYTLGYPNQEVRDALLQHLIGAFGHSSALQAAPMVVQIRQALVNGQIDKVINLLNSLFKNIPSPIFLHKSEAYYHSLVFLAFKLLGSFIESEVHTSDGRLDALVRTSTHIYLFEFKIDRSAQEALAQIRKKGYAERFLYEKKQICAVGVNFSSQKKQIEDWEMDVLEAK